MKYWYKRQWNETTGEDLTASWGTSIYYFETDEQQSVIRQMQVFEKGQVLKYSIDFLYDEFGMISDQQLDKAEFDGLDIKEVEFCTTWNNLERKTT